MRTPFRGGVPPQILMMGAVQKTQTTILSEVDTTRSPNIGNRGKKILDFDQLCLIEISGICFAIYEFYCSGCL